MQVYAAIYPAQFPTMAAAINEAAGLLSDDELQFGIAAALVRGLESSFRDRGLLG